MFEKARMTRLVQLVNQMDQCAKMAGFPSAVDLATSLARKGKLGSGQVANIRQLSNKRDLLAHESQGDTVIHVSQKEIDDAESLEAFLRGSC
jgi:hypothetical protein